MWDEETILNYLKSNLKESRFNHSLGVRDMAEKLAIKYDKTLVQKARIAGLAHDSAKNLSDDKLIGIVRQEGYVIDEVCKKQPQLLHGLAGAIIAEKVMNIRDREILNSIKFHTTGKKNMTTLEKIIYISDYVEPSRIFSGVDKLREAAFEELDKALIMAFDNTINYVVSKGELLHEDTILARNYTIINRKLKVEE
ncbi:bis(5'-nucleosyl)-tetraphosphatase (symmetrical) YqeK [Haloimpatiens massiliensis]|uniref:bis(5'-nucleosyl)-tetraphosphatase (symmetrical) YqeK n=1 Tax=Haloimpatiens massiliensis TaxID=1658110 RepID=UPI000C816A9D|nr:bis(5'-nucleosyl)-tetraphosphatase (symmetrical) YqeK [Haloimpatiens massiliensis]